jgi:methionyl-tRNA formyltransferase
MPLRLIFMGTPDFAVPTLVELARQGHDIAAVYTRAAKPGGLLATCLQHEIDHLNGVLFIDHISKLKRDRVIKKYTKAAKLGKAPGTRAAE